MMAMSHLMCRKQRKKQMIKRIHLTLGRAMKRTKRKTRAAKARVARSLLRKRMTMAQKLKSRRVKRTIRVMIRVAPGAL